MEKSNNVIQKTPESSHPAIEEEIGLDTEALDEGSRRYYRILIGLFLAVLIILMSIPGIRQNPEPSPVNAIEPTWNFNYSGHRLDSIADAGSIPLSPIVRNVAVQIISEGCKEGDTCYAKALFYYVRDQINYVKDPPYEYIQGPEETLLGAGDCEDKAILLAALLKSIGIRPRIILVPGHAFVEAYIPTAPRSAQKDGWVGLDPACASCGFGEVLPQYRENRQFVDI